MSEKIKFNICPNPDKEALNEVTEAVAANDGYCCCMPQKTEETKCMCKEFRESQETGFCHCGRFYKVKQYPIMTFICAPKDTERAEVLAQLFTSQGFITLTPNYGDEMFYFKHSEILKDVQRAKIAKADIVFVINDNTDLMPQIEEEIYWAEELKKKILYSSKEEYKNET